MAYGLVKRGRYCYSMIRKRLVHVNLQLLYTCNFKCRICDFWKEPYLNLPRMTVDQVKIIAQKLKPFGPQIISIGGGEPLMHRDIEEITRILARDNFPVMICNGWFVTPQKARALFNAGMVEISISVDYADPIKHDAQRGVAGAYDRALSALKTLHENRTEPHQRVHMISVIMNDNSGEVQHLITLAEKLGITYLITLYSCGRGGREHTPHGSDLSALLLDLRKSNRNFIALPGYLSRFTEAANSSRGIIPCYAGKNLINIDSQGNVTRCIDMLDSPAGNIFHDDMTILMNNLGEQQQNGKCGGCWTSCRGSIETLLYGKHRLTDVIESYHLTRNIPLHEAF